MKHGCKIRGWGECLMGVRELCNGSRERVGYAPFMIKVCLECNGVLGYEGVMII